MKQRNEWLDLWRSFAVIAMLLFHAFWDLEYFGALPPGTMETPFADLIRYCTGGSFILISGVLVLRSEDPKRRGFRIFCLGLAVSVVTALISLPVRFGILQLLGVCMMLCGALRSKIARARGPLLAAISLLLFIASWILLAHVTVPWRLLYPLGLRSEDYYSADYWPLLPWSFLYLLGVNLGALAPPHKSEQRRIPNALTFAGRHSLIIYLVHQPILFGLFYLLFSGKTVM